jgi:hypothetical protein
MRVKKRAWSCRVDARKWFNWCEDESCAQGGEMREARRVLGFERLISFCVLPPEFFIHRKRACPPPAPRTSSSMEGNHHASQGHSHAPTTESPSHNTNSVPKHYSNPSRRAPLSHTSQQLCWPQPSEPVQGWGRSRHSTADACAKSFRALIHCSTKHPRPSAGHCCRQSARMGCWLLTCWRAGAFAARARQRGG